MLPESHVRILLAVHKLGDTAHGGTVGLLAQLGTDNTCLHRGVYMTLHRMCSKGLLVQRRSGSRPVYHLTVRGKQQLRATLDEYMVLRTRGRGVK